MTEEAIKILKDFLKNPDDYFAQNYPHIPLAFYSSVELAIKAMQQEVENRQKLVKLLDKAYEDCENDAEDSAYPYYQSQYKQGYLRGIETAENVVRNFYKLEQEEE